jgi:hypothetical protein
LCATEAGVIRGARVALTGPDFKTVVTVADDDGAFKFSGLPPGAYRLWGARPGYITASYGEKKPGSGLPGAWVVLDASQHREQLKLQLARGAVVAGVVRDGGGDSAAGAMVLAGPDGVGERTSGTRAHGNARGERPGLVPLLWPAARRVHRRGHLDGHWIHRRDHGQSGDKGGSLAPMELHVPLSDDNTAMPPSPTYYPQATRIADSARIILRPATSAPGSTSGSRANRQFACRAWCAVPRPARPREK